MGRQRLLPRPPPGSIKRPISVSRSCGRCRQLVWRIRLIAIASTEESIEEARHRPSLPVTTPDVDVLKDGAARSAHVWVACLLTAADARSCGLERAGMTNSIMDAILEL